MNRAQPLHEVQCSFCGARVPCWCLSLRDHRLWCPACEDRYVVASEPDDPEIEHLSRPSPGRAGHKSWFLADLTLCQSFLARQSLAPVCDTSVRSLLITPTLRLAHLPHVRSVLGILDVVPCMPPDELAPLVRQRPDVIWISVGTPFGSPLGQSPAREVISDGRLVGVAGTSPLTGGYAGIALSRGYERAPCQMVARFCGGIAHLEPSVAFSRLRDRAASERAAHCWRCKAPLPVTDGTRGKKTRCPRCRTKQELPR